MSTVDYRIVLADLEARRREMDVAIAAIKRLIPEGGDIRSAGGAQSAPVVQRNGGARREDGPALPDRIVALMDAHVENIYTCEDIVATLGSDAKSTRSALARIASKGRIAKLSRGRYASAKRKRGNIFDVVGNEAEGGSEGD